MSRPRNTCRESAEMISAGTPPSRSARASASERPVLPVAVEPAMTRSGGAPAPGSGIRDGSASKGIWAGVLDADVDEGAEPRRRPEQVDELVLAGPPGEVDVAAPLPRLVPVDRVVVMRTRRHDGIDHDLDVSIEPGLVALEPDRLLHAEQRVQAPALVLGRDVVGEMRRGGARPLRVGSGEDLVVANALEQPQRRLELFLGLAAEADADVRADRNFRDRLANPLEPLEIVLDRVLAAHALEDRVVARLDREVQRLAHRRAVGHGFDQPVGQVPRVRGDEAQAWDRRAAIRGAQVVDRADELRQIRA